MFSIAMKYFTLIFSSLLVYKKILNLKHKTGIRKILPIVFSLGLAYLMFLFQDISSLRIAVMVLFIGIFNSFLTKTKIDLAITITIIAIGMSYAFYYIAATFAAFSQQILFSSENINILASITFIITPMISNIPFLFKRTRKGFLFLQGKEAGGIGLIISGIIVLFIALMSIRHISDAFFEALLIGVSICIAGIILWWRNSLTKLYIEKLKDQNLKELETVVAEKDEQIQKLNERNDFLAGVIHRDNKLIPAMYHAVQQHMKTDSSFEEGQTLLDQLEQIMSERSGIILRDQREHKILPSTKVELLDNTLNYMYLKATEKDIEFDFRITGDITYMIESVIPTLKLQTLLADFIENAVIATANCEYKRILVTMGITDDAYELIVQDSGIPFQLQILKDLGIRKVTTYKLKGGSGIGFMTAFEIMRETSASLIITEYPPKLYSFSKIITIRFDGRNEYVIRTFRDEEIRKACINNTGMMILPLYQKILVTNESNSDN